jgi:transcriptional regulator with XRE-family HTH domain
VVETGTIADELRRWRTRRRWSQLELANRAGTTQRHLSFIEQGRSRPGRAIVVRLAESLGLSLRERNALLLAAGYAPAFAESSLDGPELEPPVNVLRIALHPEGMAPRVENLAEWGRHIVESLRTLAGRSPDERLDAFISELDGYLPAVRPGPDHLGFAVPLRLRAGTRRCRS